MSDNKIYINDKHIAALHRILGDMASELSMLGLSYEEAQENSERLNSDELADVVAECNAIYNRLLHVSNEMHKIVE